MGNPKTTIEINGKRYDARTGQILSSVPISSPLQRPISKPHQGQILDGFMRRPASRNVHTQPAVASEPAAKKTVSASSRSSAQTAKRKLEKSKTLMRPAVKKPEVKNDIQPVKKPEVKKTPVPSSRIARAESTYKSPFVSRFGNNVSTVVKKAEVLPVVSPVPAAIAPSIPAIGNAVALEIKKLEHALQDTNAHIRKLEKKAVKKVPLLNRVGFKNKYANLAAMSCAFLLLVGFFAYQNAAVLSMKVAAQRSGVQAKLPGYKPAGYGVEGGVKSEPGKVSVTFKSRTDTKSFTVTQKASNWNSTALLANHVIKARCNTCFQTWQNDGKTVYIYDNSNATWVNGGVWYEVAGDADLTTDQLLRLANSL